MPVFKQSIKYKCSECGHVSTIKTGKCMNCGAWGTLEPEAAEPVLNLNNLKLNANAKAKSNLNLNFAAAPAKVISAVNVEPPERIATGINELDRVLGGGLVPGGVVLIGGQPGIGKSTLLLQAAGSVAKTGRKVLYISGEESEAQVALRAARINASSQNLLLSCGANLDSAIASLNNVDDIAFFVLDSVQALRISAESDAWAGTPTQVRAVAQAVIDIARLKNIPAVMIGHITKDGKIAGPMLLEHMVDTVLNFSGEGYSSYRMLRALKNRYGSTDELGVFEMDEAGLTQVEDKSNLYWNKENASVPGVAMTIALEGNTPLAAEIQILAARTVFPYPRRTSRGVDLNKFQLLTAVIERRCGIATNNHDLYLNIAGGLYVQDPSADLAACAAIASALKNTALDAQTCWLGETGLAGEIRPVTRLNIRLKEAERLGFKNAVISSRERVKPKDFKDLNIIKASHLAEALASLIVASRR
ncbi:MAG: DNA repair protein RadA [Synergistaceae bacterium]|nr:DNA repair protein RadA [Synergistaceae bacterium]